MAKASTLIMRDAQDSQFSSANQLWAIRATEGTKYEVGFLKEFVKKHLFVDPDTRPKGPGLKMRRKKVCNSSLARELGRPY